MGDEAAATPEPPKTTTSGAHGLFQADAWLTAAAVAAFSTRALWLKLRNLGSKKSKNEDEIAEKQESQLPEEEQIESKLQVLDVDVI
ncbi:uncharacterized protein LOC132789979 [Drosophila nasuta]|uniref:Uncharacterized protein LOC127565618 n=1 Tax=Drosophila albomicans TaxID=7291 RepID=A0A9C6T3X1_DROAB|nr:uncharacterized protein LOC127565618 [Drosophila albomicans]XP_051860991.1 uncharacterized protein LOC127565618 [Drosophila albomicans]XP_060654341.1 uncharacterized protein LOC132789979 [Drosophila nasuta]XP_060654342.1 uncharacterized protein LOC132789979 [Drosophila nasuta]